MGAAADKQQGDACNVCVCMCVSTHCRFQTVRVLCLPCGFASVCMCVCVIISGSQLEQIHRKTNCVKAVPCISATCSLQLDCRSSFNTTNTFSVRIKTIDLQALQPQLVHHCYCALKHGTLVYLTSKCWCCSHNIIIKAAPGPSLELV